VITCDGDQGTRTVVSPDGDGNLCDPTSNQCDAVTDPLDLLFQAQVSRGAEAVSGLDKVYWNLALGVKKASMAGKACTLTATATADDHAQDGLDGTFRGAQAGEIEAGAVYPTVTWSVPLSTVGGGAFACTQHGLGSDEVTTAYTATTALEPRDLKWCYDPDGPCCAVDGPQCGLAACDADTGECVGCKAKTTTDFESGLGNWIIYDAPGVADAVLVSGAAPQNHYIRLTADTGGAGNYQRGQIYNTTDVIDAGGVSVRFDFRASNVAGNAPNPADGLALTIVKATPAQLTGDILPNAGFGGGLGYHYPGHGYEAVTVEIDLLENQTNGFDPAGSGMHIAVTRNLDASSHLAWVNVPNLSANVWRTVEVRLVGTVVQIWLGGALLTEAQTSVDFSGGLMFFSAGTGEWWAEHDVDNVLVDHGCSDAPVVYTGNRALFVTSGTYVPGAGDFTGVSGADAICQQVADAAPLLQAVRPNARWRAWLSTSGVNAALHVGATDGPFVTFYGSASAPQQALIGTSLTSYSFQGFPATYEDGAGTGPTEVWTGTNGDGSFAGAAASCSDFTSASSGISGRYGKPNYVTSNWTSYGDQTCNVASHLYCVQMRD
ncbi:MAG: hypothetical protein KC635_25280, partial [Myxococcales bacterium]|nr:hypothetical protein [Myxococcales bacterium]